MSDKYKTYEELKEELGNKFEEYMYKANIELLEKIDIGGFCELKKKCDEGLCDCTNEEYNSMAECNMRISLENDALQQENKQLKEKLEVSQDNEETYRLEMLEITKILGLDEHTLFDDVKLYAKNLNSILTELEEWLNHQLNDYKVLYKMYGNPYFMIEEYEKILKKIQELKEKYK